MKTVENGGEDKPEKDSPYLSLRIYKNYEQTMKVKNLQRKKDGLGPIRIRDYKEWSGK